ncbi:MAG: GxxExxY protein [Anaerolineales bacterium]
MEAAKGAKSVGGMMTDLVYKDEVYKIISAAMEVHKALGSGFLEAVYQEAMEIETSSKGIPFVSQKVIQIQYKQHVFKKEYIADMVCYEKIIVEFKALDKLTNREEAQVINYLKATGYKVGVLINFGSHPKLEWKRFIY